MQFSNVDFGKRLKQARYNLGLTQAELAEKLNMGSSASVSIWESGKKSPALEHLVEICNILHIPISYFFLSEGLDQLQNDTIFPTSFLSVEEEKVIDQVWLVSRTLKNDVEDGIAVSTTQNNISRGISYTFIIDDKDEIVNGRLFELIRTTFVERPDLLTVFRISADNFRFLTYQQIVFFNPLRQSNGKSSVYGEISDTNHTWLKISPGESSRLVGVVVDIIKTCKNFNITDYDTN